MLEGAQAGLSWRTVLAKREHYRKVFHQFDIARAADTGYFRAVVFRELHGECADAAGRAVDQDFLARFDLTFVAQALQRRECRNRHGRSLLEGHICRLGRDRAALADYDILRDGAVRTAEYFVARLETRDALTDGFDRAGEVDPDAHILRRAEAGREAHEIRRAAHRVPVDRIQSRRVHFHEQLVVRGGRLGELIDGQHVWCAIAASDESLHGLRSRRQRRGGAARRAIAERDGERCEGQRQNDSDDAEDAVA